MLCLYFHPLRKKSLSLSCILLWPTYSLTIRLPKKRIYGVSSPKPQKKTGLRLLILKQFFSVFYCKIWRALQTQSTSFQFSHNFFFPKAKEKRAHFLVSWRIASAFRLLLHFRNTVMQSASGNSWDGVFSDTGIWIRSYSHLLPALADLTSVTIDSSIKAPNGWVCNFKA